ncbi:MAG: GWxTD domain-containing protein [Candidatus Eisenbacteria bacterium]|nr:GWxTD domain-containing protein [Candidatus Eisenbacteria bacterium]
MRRIALYSLLAALAVGSGASGALAATRAAQAESLYAHAQGMLARGTIDARRQALRELEQATLLAPGNAACELTLARTYYGCGFLRSARRHFERVRQIDPDDGRGCYGLGLVWRRDWLKYLDHSSLDRAAELFSTAVRLDSSFADAWLALVPLLVERGDLKSASAAAFSAARAGPRRFEAHLAVAYTLYRLGMLREADSVFTSAIPHLRRSVRERYEDIGPIATEQDTITLHHLPDGEQAAFVARFWKELDPDLASPENEARLEYWSRVTHAFFLYFDARRDEWDERGEVYVRYGPPAEMDYNPVGQRLSVSFGTGPEFPANILVWNYPDLGMRVTLQDRLLSEYYLLPISLYRDMDPVPNPDSLAKCENALATRGGRGVFHRLPPGVAPLPLEVRVAGFEGGSGPRLLAQLEAPGAPADSLWAAWVVLASTRREVQRGARALAPSACEATTRRVADFAAELAPGDYLVGVTVRDRARRGVYRVPVTLHPPGEGLRLSDVVVACGTPNPAAGPAVRIEPNPAARVAAGQPLAAYFEIYHLRAGRDGLARFEYVYTVKSAEKDPRVWLQRVLQPRVPPPAISVTREEENVGPLRRQFVSVPVQSLPAGKYRLEIRVRDLVAGGEATRSAEFVKLAAPRD